MKSSQGAARRRRRSDLNPGCLGATEHKTGLRRVFDCRSRKLITPVKSRVEIHPSHAARRS
jgi:hypothetical protein